VLKVISSMFSQFLIIEMMITTTTMITFTNNSRCVCVCTGILIEGVGSLLDGIMGTGNGTTSTSINVGVVGLTKVSLTDAFAFCCCSLLSDQASVKCIKSGQPHADNQMRAQAGQLV